MKNIVASSLFFYQKPPKSGVALTGRDVSCAADDADHGRDGDDADAHSMDCTANGRGCRSKILPNFRIRNFRHYIWAPHRPCQGTRLQHTV